MKKAVCFFTIILTALAGTAQHKTIDSLQSLLQQTKTDTAKIRKLTQLGLAYREIKNDSALAYFKDALQLSQKIGYTKGEIRARSAMAGFLNFIKSDYSTALDLYLQNLKREEQTGDTSSIFWDTRDISFIYERIEDFQKQLEYTNRLTDLINKGITKDSAILIRYKVVVDNRLGGLYAKLNKLDSAKFYRNRVYSMGVAKNDLQWIALGSSGLAEVYRNLKVRDSAIYYYHICMDVASKINRKDIYGGGLLGLGEVYWDNKQADSAFTYCKKAFSLGQAEMNNTLIMNAAALLAKIYFAKKQPDSAYQYLNQSVVLKDSIFGSDNIAKIQNLSLKESLQRLQEEQTKKEAVQEYRSSVLTYSFIAGLVILTFIIFILYRNNRQRHAANKKIQKAYKDLQSTQAQLIQSEKMASLGELTSGIAHEIQNPLNFVNNFSEVNKDLIAEMKQEIKKGNFEEVNVIANDIEANEGKIIYHGKRADAIVKGMLQHSRSSTGQKEPTKINALADEYLRLCYHGLLAKDKSFNATLQTGLDESIAEINIIPQDIGRVLLNLYNNAFYAVNEKSRQNIDNYEPTVSVSTKKINDKVEISVKDNGNGIPAKILDKIFQPFFTTKPTGQGTGLGLSLSYDIVKAHGGEIKVETNQGEGTEFIINLPILFT